MDVSLLTVSHVRPHVGSRFRLHANDVLDLDLVELDESGSGSAAPPEAARAPFSVVFLGPREPVLPQRIYRLEHDELGTLDLFLVPIARDAAGVRYEAVFN
jgi:Domain of unknown function (DUF6916)